MGHENARVWVFRGVRVDCASVPLRLCAQLDSIFHEMLARVS